MFTKNRTSNIKHSTLLNIQKKLYSLLELKDGWHEGEGTSLSKDWLDSLMGIIKEHYPRDLPTPNISPIGDGGVRFSWKTNKLLMYVAILDYCRKDLEQAEFSIIYRDSSRVGENTALDITNADGWNTISRNL